MRQLVLLSYLLFQLVLAHAQVEYGGTPLTKQYNITLNGVPETKLPALSNLKYYTDSMPSNFVGPTRILDIDLMKESKTYIVDNKWIGLYKISSIAAKELFINFDQFKLSDGASVFFHSDEVIKGSYRKANLKNFKKNIFSGPILPNDNCIIEVNCPLNEVEQNKIHCSKLCHILKNTSGQLKSTTDVPGAACNINVNCEEGDPWCNQIRSVVNFYYQGAFDGYEYCSGALVNNTSYDFTPYILTAKHCTDLADFETYKFLFNFQTPTCTTVGIPILDWKWAVNGADFHGSCSFSTSDVALLEVLEPIPPQYNVYYAGWNIGPRDLYENVHVIHHPNHYEKKITSGQLQFSLANVWDTYWDDGVITGGSSGSPVFNNTSKTIIGVISRSVLGYEYDCEDDPKHTYVGKLRSCWEDGDIIDYLADGNDNVEGMGGIDPIRACQDNIELYAGFYDARIYRAVKHNILIQAENTINIATDEEAIFFDESNYTLTAGESITFKPGSVVNRGAILKAKIAECNYTEEVCGFNYNKTEPVGILYKPKDRGIKIYPNPTKNICNVELYLDEEQPLTITLTNLLGETVKTIAHQNSEEGKVSMQFNTSEFSSGIYFVVIDIGKNRATKKLVIGQE